MSHSLLSQVFARRQLMGFGAAAGAALLAEQVSVAQSPAAAVADRTTSIRLTGLRATVCRDRVFIKLGTNHGVSGWGEIKGVVPAVAKSLAEAMFDLLDGQNPTRIEHLWQMLYRAERMPPDSTLARPARMQEILRQSLARFSWR
jgi:ABC-type amino acid transport substrate-binding protein